MNARLKKMGFLSMMTALVLLFNQFAFIILHDHSNEISINHHQDLGQGIQLHHSECTETCFVCDLFTLKIYSSLEDQGLFFHPYIKIVQTRRLFTYYPSQVTQANSRAPPSI